MDFPLRTEPIFLKHFLDVLEDMQTKEFTFRAEPLEKVNEKSIELWTKRGYIPSNVGVAHVLFKGNKKDFMYPLYMWCK